MNIGTDPPQHITDIGQGIDTLRQVFGESTTVDVAPRTTGLNMHLSSVTLPMLVLGHVTFGAELALRGRAAAYHVATLRAGRLQTTWEDGQQRTSEAGSVAGPTWSRATRAPSFSAKRSCTLVWTNRRLGHTQVCPPLRNFDAMSPATAASRSASKFRNGGQT